MIEVCSDEGVRCAAEWARLILPTVPGPERDWFDYLTLIVGTLSAVGTVAAAWTAVVLARAQTKPSLALELVPKQRTPGAAPDVELKFLNTGLMPVMVRDVELWCGWLPYFRIKLDLVAHDSGEIVLPIRVDYGHTEIRIVSSINIVIRILALKNWGRPKRVEHHGWITRRLRFVVETSTGHRFVCPAPFFVQQVVADAYASAHGRPAEPASS